MRVLGTFGNCAGGETPWGTYLTAEENIQDYFGNLDRAQGAQRRRSARRRCRIVACACGRRTRCTAGKSSTRASICRRRRREPFRFGWIVEIDPHDPTRTPVKRTALGRFAHEGANPFVAHDGRVAVYMGDDDKFEYIYKFVSDGRFDPKNPAANRDLLDRGTLYVARLRCERPRRMAAAGVRSEGPAECGGGFSRSGRRADQGARRRDVLGATPMDRPEDVEANPVTGRIYVACTRNEQRSACRATHDVCRTRSRVRARTPRIRAARIQFGHIIEIREAGDDHTAREFSWEVFLLGGRSGRRHA